ncbi:hypothetical+protein [Methylocapsa aurea]|uniref:hypothetical protein n=1 Tax=Methylocapsa aurea TaxID=663610 RepID=UPI003D18DACC
MHYIANPLTAFLSSYGPSSSSDALCDENAVAAARQSAMQPIDTVAPRLGDVEQAIFVDGTSVILTGTAGDGKTYHIRRFFETHFPDRLADWPGDDGIVTANLPDGRQLRIIRDLSEVSDEEKENELVAFTEALTKTASKRLYLVAANDGQLLKYFRDAASFSDDQCKQFSLVHERLAEMLRADEETRSDLRLKLINLSRVADSTIDQIFGAVLNHPAWSRCNDCGGKDVCPIRLNRSLLLETSEQQSPFRHRLRQGLRLAAANDQHVPIRQLLMLVVNILLGDARQPDAPLLTCATAQRRAVDNEYRYTNPYDNAAGMNLRPERRSANRVFAVFEVFGIGHETNNLIDTLLIENEPADRRSLLFDGEQTYGAALFEPLRREYHRGNARDDRSIRPFRSALESQRRRAFFRLPDDHSARDMHSPWQLTIFQYGGCYLRLIDALEITQKHEIVDPLLRLLIRGLNRAYTGMMTVDDNKLWLAGTVGKTDDPAGRVATIEAIDRANTTAFHTKIEFDLIKRRPLFRIAAPRMFRPVPAMPALDLKPLLFEYLMRVANGSLPASFSRQCHQEIRHFALVTIAAMRKLQQSADDDLEQVNVLALGPHGEIQASQIGV